MLGGLLKVGVAELQNRLSLGSLPAHGEKEQRQARKPTAKRSGLHRTPP
jgi:hypothetical protein